MRYCAIAKLSTNGKSNFVLYEYDITKVKKGKGHQKQQEAKKVDSLDHDSESDEAAKTRASYARQLRLRWLRLISLTRVRTIAERLCGASASAAKAAAAATRHQVRRGLFVDASIGLPLGV